MLFHYHDNQGIYHSDIVYMPHNINRNMRPIDGLQSYLSFQLLSLCLTKTKIEAAFDMPSIAGHKVSVCSGYGLSQPNLNFTFLNNTQGLDLHLDL